MAGSPWAIKRTGDFTEEEAEMIVTLSKQVALAYENLLLMQKLQENEKRCVWFSRQRALVLGRGSGFKPVYLLGGGAIPMNRYY